MIKCEKCGLWHGNSKNAHLRPAPKVAGLFVRSDDYPEIWPWIYFHGQAEDHVMAYQDHLILKGEIEKDNWEAPDLVRSNTPIEQVEDGKFNRVDFVDGTEMLLTLWSTNPEYKQDYQTGVFNFKAHRRGLITLYSDKEAREYAFECFDKRQGHL